MIIENNVLTAEDGMVLTNGEVYSTKVYLGIYDRPSNWQEIPESEAKEPEEEEEKDYETAFRIIAGMEG